MTRGLAPWRRLAVVLAAVAFSLSSGAMAKPVKPTPQQGSGPFADWVAVVAAGDYRAHSGKPAEVFDNARRDISKALTRDGFAPANIVQFSVRPKLYPDNQPFDIRPPDGLYNELKRLTDKSPGGCLFYLTSHGSPQGALYGDVLLPPDSLKLILDQTCGTRPTLVVVSACFSGVFIPALAAPNRVVLTAARPDRTSFGCGEAEVYTYFDTCILDALASPQTFMTLAESARVCVEKHEVETHMTPPSEPQTFVGSDIRFMLPLLKLQPQPPG